MNTKVFNTRTGVTETSGTRENSQLQKQHSYAVCAAFKLCSDIKLRRGEHEDNQNYTYEVIQQIYQVFLHRKFVLTAT